MKTKYTKKYYKMWMMPTWAFVLGTAGFFLGGHDALGVCLLVLGGIVVGLCLGHSMGIVIYYICKWRYPDRVEQSGSGDD
jgi:Na+/H+ antiporter NhaA